MTAGTMTAAAPLLTIERWPDTNRAAAGACCSSGRDVGHHTAGAQCPVPFKGTASNVACPYCTLSGRGIKGKLLTCQSDINVSSSQVTALAPTPWQSSASHVRPSRVFAAIRQSADVAYLRPPHTRSCLTPGEAKAGVSSLQVSCPCGASDQGNSHRATDLLRARVTAKRDQERSSTPDSHFT